jgi:hypothetical protein
MILQFSLKVSGSGTRENIISSLAGLISIFATTPDEEMTNRTLEDATLISEIDINIEQAYAEEEG